MLAQLKEQVNANVGTWDVFLLVRLMAEIVAAKNNVGDNQERDSYFELGNRVEDMIVKALQQEVETTERNLARDFTTPSAIRYQRQALLTLREKAPTKRVRREIVQAGNEMQQILDRRSQQAASDIIARIENHLHDAEQCDYRTSASLLDSVVSDLRLLEKTPHLKFVGVPKFAYQKGTTAEALMAGFKNRLETMRSAVDSIAEEMFSEERKRAEEARKQRDLERNPDFQLASIIEAISARNAKIGATARRFLENVRLRNKGAAKSCIEELRRVLGGVHPLFQQKYADLLRA